MNKKNIIFMGTPSIAANYLDVLINNKYNIVSVFTQPHRKKNRGMKTLSTPVEELAIQNNIKVHTPNKLDNESLDLIKSYKPDLVIVMAYGLIIPSKFLEVPLFGFINIHLSLLPRWRGASPIEHTLLYGDKNSGISIIKLNDKLDAGPVLIQKKISIENYHNKKDLINILNATGCDLLIDTIPKILKDNIKFQIQNEKYATYAHKLNSESRRINFDHKAFYNINKIRAFSPHPASWFTYKNERIKIISAILKNDSGNPGTILDKNFSLCCLDGSIAPTYLQREGKKIMQIDEFLRGFSFKVGDTLNE
tara:strand:+ start:9368 stop:10291 length:924 start_codon:yes stop_codon:yes gene_type:complete